MFHNETVHDLVLSDRSLPGGPTQSGAAQPRRRDAARRGRALAVGGTVWLHAPAAARGRGGSAPSAALLRVVQCLGTSSSGWRPGL